MSIELTDWQYTVLLALRQHPGRHWTVETIASEFGLDQSQVAALAVDAERWGWLRIEAHERQELSLAPGFQPGQGLPERQFLESLAESGQLAIKEASSRAEALGLALNEILKWGVQRGWYEKKGASLCITQAGLDARKHAAADEKAIECLAEHGPQYLEDLSAHGINAAEVERSLAKRPAVVRFKTRVVRILRLTPAGLEAKLTRSERQTKTRLSTEDITSGAWKSIDLKPYDVTLAAEPTAPVKAHPFQRILEETRRAFLEMGFTEIVSPMVESAFWDFDALFQPQDHPARDMQDTFYLSRPATGSLPDPALVERVRRTHEDGGDTDSTGWGYRWSEERARQMVLRTHTTASTIRALARDPRAPRKAFCVGRVFRNENITYKHLPEFTQVDGIIIDENANFSMLLGTLREFYRKMGFSKVKFKPEFFPYTEPSAGVFVYMESRGKWLELGGSGIFRPEVTKPLGCDVPVLAWGLGLERLAMQRYGMEDIRTLYWSDLDWLKEVPLCQ